MQVTGTSSVNQTGSTSTNTNNNNKKTDEFLFEENNRQAAQTVSVKADIADVGNSLSAPILIGTLLSGFADDIINFLSGNLPETQEDVENQDNPDLRITPTAGTTNFVA